jgi:hypothetical protein
LFFPVVEHAMEGCCDANHATQKPRSHDTSRIAWAKLMARVGEEFPFACPWVWWRHPDELAVSDIHSL